MAKNNTTTPALDFKSATLYAIRVVLHSGDTAAIQASLDQRMRDAGAFFENEPVVIDATKLDQAPDWNAIVDALRGHKLFPIGAMVGDDMLESARACGLAAVDLASAAVRSPSKPAPEKETPVIAPNGNRADAGDAGERNGTGGKGGKSAATSENSTAGKAVKTAAGSPAPEAAPAAMVINRPLRSGQRIYARQTDLIVIGAVNQGAEIIADGNIHVYGPLRGKAMAGARGDTSARIFATQLDPELLAIAGVYRVIETRLDQSGGSHPMQVKLEGEALRIIALDQ
jgi:septum site-determining protein MinC